MPNQELLNQLTLAYDKFTTFIKDNEAQWKYRPSAERWSMGQHAEHLWLSGLSIASILKQDDTFFTQFDATGHPPRTYKELEQNYFACIAAGVKAHARQTPPADFSKPSIEFLTNWKAVQQKTINRLNDNWTESRLDEKTVLHPALGLITIRELLFFTDFHIYHHLKTLNNEYLE